MLYQPKPKNEIKNTSNHHQSPCTPPSSPSFTFILRLTLSSPPLIHAQPPPSSALTFVSLAPNLRASLHFLSLIISPPSHTAPLCCSVSPLSRTGFSPYLLLCVSLFLLCALLAFNREGDFVEEDL